jgi:hypothetical protein
MTLPNGPVFILAGYVARVEQWMKFSDEWQEMLDRTNPRGPLKYFKMREANSLRKQFWGWSERERDARVDDFVGIIKRNVIFGVRAFLWWEDFNVVRQDFPNWPVEPYDILFSHVMARTTHSIRKRNLDDRVDFIFDEQGPLGDRAAISYRLSLPLLPPELSCYVGSPPMHKSDEEFLPLQAADMMAWQSRRFCSDNVAQGENHEAYCTNPVMESLDETDIEDINLHHVALREFFEELTARLPNQYSF